MSKPPILTLADITKRFDTQEVLSGFNLSIEDGEFFTILGPSGCGKTTVLRLIAGFEGADEGRIMLNGQDVSKLSAEKRPVNTVFQSYALFPHMTVFDNVAFGLKMAKVSKPEIAERVKEALATVRLSDFATRKPHQLSGGQKQRVAIARAVVNRPKVLLLDESLSALDYKLRQQMQMELKQLQRKLGITFIYVTHDQEEALSMSDRVLVMHNGQAQQVGTPREIYECPNNLFVASFIGEINVFNAEILESLGDYRYVAAMDGFKREIHADRRFEAGDKVHVLLRPEDLRIEYLEDAPDRPGFSGKVLERNYTGQTLDSQIQLPSGQTIMASEFFDEDDPDFDYSINQKVWVDWVHGWEHVIKAES
ncbi:spermidine/putrescine ABC transporter ATP-binding protein PotA [Hahella sp. KA22]|uniref:spermidine/putrescine ABC transporter ATP-binding protein PotA n=1 Tax=Hahella sp. KA22 TaxID=1628392 RepID=UPI000FDE01C7|nr:spermidine/putrescine ABC transporter ATP-binding protein PotA [Hahella sp. KA22]AZZ93420.1 spermidine/putrescine ABC transporter ATP-binding protein PotA [Hahella sp. KA22]QAY56795.1 spermidine/putrescine ABC transporter ATP-binding protein PotA [Hahella sp. KA22]